MPRLQAYGMEGGGRVLSRYVLPGKEDLLLRRVRGFPCAEMRDFYRKSESHERAYALMRAVREGKA